ncbi:MAG: zinc-dependent metalloprotease, partial [Planctomycetes bacterium]|nr:zinc-dependent metalloprotease [Planctomycetota bacterium]
ASADDTVAKKAKDKPAAAADEESEQKPEKKKPDFPPFDEVGKDHEPVAAPDGSFWKLYYNKKTDHLLAEIPKSTLDKNFLMATSISGGPRLTGYMWGDQVVQWQEMDQKLVLIAPDLRYKKGEKSELADVIQRTYTDTIVLATPIVSKKDGNPVIDLDKLLKADRAGLGRIYGGTVDASLSRYAKKKAFPSNLELAVDLAIMRGDSGGIRGRVHYSISELPKNDYQPRVADDRIGYFMTAIKDWTKPHDDRTIFHRYIHRWQLRKEDPKAAVSDVNPDDQIVFYIEKTVPKQFRRYVRAGILEWNKAFEKAGLRNAVAVRQQTDKTFANIDPEDVRYNFFRWIVSGRSFAMGPSRANPLTGQILDADIIFDDSMVRVWEARYADLAAKGPAADYDPQLTEFLQRYPEWNFVPLAEQLLPDSYSVAGVDLSWDPSVLGELPFNKAGFCTYAQGMMHEMSFGRAVIQASGEPGLAEKFVGQMIKEVVAHEVGHTLGLRHNFKASAWKSLEEIMANKDENVPVCASVMDYNPGMFALDPEQQGVYVTTTLGPYDYWAIEYGYRTTDDEYSSEEELLEAITSRCAEPGLAYATDEDTMFFAPDPLANRFDNGDDPIKFAKQRMEMALKLLSTCEEWAVKEGESYNELRKSFDMLLAHVSRAARFAARYVGGQYVHRDHKGDPNARAPFVMVPVAKQREALTFLIENLFSDRAFQFSPELLNKLGAGRWRHWDSDAYDSQLEYPVHDRVAAIQYWSLFHLINPYTVGRIYDAELKVPADQDTLTVPELVTKLTQAIWSEIGDAPVRKYTNRKPYISSIRRNLQRRYLEIMIRTVLGQPGRTMPADAHAVTRMTLQQLADQIGEIVVGGQASNLDDFSRAHLGESKSRIEKALEAEFRL